jgi:hypothetical protein
MQWASNSTGTAEEWIKDNNHSPVAAQALQRIAMIYRIEHEIRDLSPEDRLAVRHVRNALDMPPRYSATGFVR